MAVRLVTTKRPAARQMSVEYADIETAPDTGPDG